MTAIGIGIGTPFGSGRGGGVPLNTLIAARANFFMTGTAIDILVAHEIAAGAGSFSFSGQTASLLWNQRLDAGAGAFAMTGQAATMTIGPAPGELELNAEFGTFVFSGDTMTPLVDHTLPAGAASFAMSGQASTLKLARMLTAGAASFVMTGTDATLTKSTSYTGPGDLASGASAWWSCARAYSAAFAAGGTPIMDLVDQAGANSIAINILSTGFVDTAAIAAWVTANSVSTIRVTKLYDQTGNGLHATNATLSTMPALTLNALNSLPVMTFTNARGDRLNTATFTLAQPFSMNGVSQRTANFTTEQGILGATPTVIDLAFNSSTNTALVRSGSSLTRTANNSAWHTLSGVYNGASSAIVIDGTATTGAGGTNGFSAVSLRIGRSSAGGSIDGQIADVGLWPYAFNSTQYGDVDTNPRAAGVYNF